MRFLQVRKLRGGDFRSGQHAYRLSREGLHLFPRLADIPAAGDYPLGDQRISTGLDALDAMLADGFWPGASTLVAGPTGSGKTVMGLRFIFAGARRGEPGVIATLQENPTQLQRMLGGLGWPADDPAIEVMYRSPVDIYIDEWVYDLLRTVERTGARRILLDSLMDRSSIRLVDWSSQVRRRPTALPMAPPPVARAPELIAGTARSATTPSVPGPG